MPTGVDMRQTLIRGGLLIDGTGKPALDKGAILIEGGRILSVGKEEEIRKNDDIQVVDCADQTLLPGLIDCHNHLSLDPRLRIICIAWLIPFLPSPYAHVKPCKLIFNPA